MEKVWFKHYQEGVPEEINLDTYSSIADLFEQSCKKYWDAPAFNNFGTTLTFKQIYEDANNFAAYLSEELKLEPGSRIALMMPNILQYPIAMYGAFLAGLVVVNVNPLYTARELKHQLVDANVKAIVIFESAASILQEVYEETEIEHIIVTNIGDCLQFPKSILINFVLKYIKKVIPTWSLPGHLKFNTVLSKGRSCSLKPYETTLSDIAYLQYTGGTTGVSKGAILTHKNIIANIMQASSWIMPEIKKDATITIVTPLPLYHIFSLTANCLTFFSMGAQNILITNPRDIPAFVKTLKQFKFTAITAVNTLFNALIENEEFKSVDFSNLALALGGGMAVQRSVAEEWHRITGTHILEAYGLTESSPAACINPGYSREYNGSIGLPLPSMDVKIIDENDKELGFDETGELCIQGPNIMRGYWQREEETKKILSEDAWLKTGDIAKIDTEGYVYLVDRKKDMILVSGFNVFPNEIEDVLVSHPGISEVAAIGIPDKHSGEIVKVFIVASDKNLSEDEVRNYAKKSLTGYKRPKLIEFRSELPKTNVGKILRRSLRDEELNKPR